MWLKDDGRYGDGPWGGNKVRKLEWILPDARRRGRGTILTFGALGTNHGLATALYAREHGLRVALALVDQPLDDHVRAQLERLRGSGATLHFTHDKARTIDGRAVADRAAPAPTCSRPAARRRSVRSATWRLGWSWRPRSPRASCPSLGRGGGGRVRRHRGGAGARAGAGRSSQPGRRRRGQRHAAARPVHPGAAVAPHGAAVAPARGPAAGAQSLGGRDPRVARGWVRACRRRSRRARWRSLASARGWSSTRSTPPRRWRARWRCWSAAARGRCCSSNTHGARA